MQHANGSWCCLYIALWACGGGTPVSAASPPHELDAGHGAADADLGAPHPCRNTCLDGDDQLDACRLLDRYSEPANDLPDSYIVIDRDVLFYTSGASVRSYDLAREAARSLAQVQTGGGIAFDDAWIYAGGYTAEDNWQLYQIPRAGGAPSALRTGLRRVEGLQRSGDWLWFLDTWPADGNRVHGTRLSAQEDITVPLRTTTAVQFLVDEQRLYWTEGSSIFAQARDGSGSATKLADALWSDMIFDGDDLLWSPFAVDKQRVYRMKKQGGTPQVLGIVQPDFQVLSTDDEFVYVFFDTWAELARLPKHGADPTISARSVLKLQEGIEAAIAIASGRAYVLCPVGAGGATDHALLEIELRARAGGS